MIHVLKVIKPVDFHHFGKEYKCKSHWDHKICIRIFPLQFGFWLPFVFLLELSLSLPTSEDMASAKEIWHWARTAAVMRSCHCEGGRRTNLATTLNDHSRATTCCLQQFASFISFVTLLEMFGRCFCRQISFTLLRRAKLGRGLLSGKYSLPLLEDGKENPNQVIIF